MREAREEGVEPPTGGFAGEDETYHAFEWYERHRRPAERAQQGTVPGLPEWEYHFHGRGCCLTHKVTGEAIDVDFHDDTPEWVDDWFYFGFLESLRNPHPAERRLRERHPTTRTILLAIEELRTAGLLESRPNSKVFRLPQQVTDWSDAVEDFCRAWADPQTRFVSAAQIGDWPAAHAACAGVSAEAAAIARQRADEVVRRRSVRLHEVFAERQWASEAVSALADSADPDLPAVLERALDGPICGTTSTALDVIIARGDPAWCPALRELMSRLNPEAGAPHPWLWVRAAGFLLRHAGRDERTLAYLSATQDHSIGDAALLALEYAPDSALPLFRRALRSPIPANRQTAAAVLGLLDTAESRRKLLAVLRESEEQEATCECRVALQESRDPDARRAAEEWERLNPHEPEVGPTISMREMMLRNRDSFVRYEMNNLRERVAALAGRLPKADA